VRYFGDLRLPRGARRLYLGLWKLVRVAVEARAGGEESSRRNSSKAHPFEVQRGT